MSQKDSNKIEPVNFDLEDSPLFSSKAATTNKTQPPAWLWLAMGGLVVVALAVVFILPGIVADYELPLERRAEVTLINPGPRSQTLESQVSPFEEAQKSRQRKEAQDVLAALLESQAELDALQVSRWADSDYEMALDKAREGDEFYTQQNFIESKAAYENSLSGLSELLRSVPDVLAQTLIEGEQALRAGDADAAQASFELALVLDTRNSVAQAGLARSVTLEEVKLLLAESEALRKREELETARTTLQQAAKLDPRHEQVVQALSEVSAQILENEFSSVMSSGYALLQSAKPEQAIAAFQRASNLGINKEQALAAITQTENEISFAKIERLRNEITKTELAEQWQATVNHYQALLNIDPNLVFARQGLDYASKRLQLDKLLENAIAQPLRLADDAVFQETLDVYYTGRGIEGRGERLESQLEQLQAILENSQLPLAVEIQSDNATNINLLRVGALGSFQTHTVSLKPGNYVAVGKRDGYRDVRIEFTVGFGQTPSTLVVQCEEEI